MHVQKNGRLAIRILLVIFSVGFIVLASCDKDDDDKGTPAGNNAEGINRGEYEMTFEGAINDTLNGDSATFVDTFSPQDPSTAAFVVDLGNDTVQYHFRGVVFKENADLVDKGTYEAKAQQDLTNLETGAAANLTVGMDTNYIIDNNHQLTGHIEITTRTESEVQGKIHNLILYKDAIQELDSVIINGSFRAIPGEI